MTTSTARFVPALLAAVISCGFGTSTWAATGTISPNPCHLTIETGSTGTTTITWSTSGCQTAEVYVSMDGGSETLFARAASGSQNATWISAGHYYIFRLYEGTAHSNLLAWTNVTNQYQDNMLGFSYWPPGMFCDVLYDTNWTAAQKEAIEADLDHMSSLSGGIVRFVLLPQLTGWSLSNGFENEFNECCDNIVELLGMLDERDMRGFIVFGNNYFACGNGNPGHRWWQDEYGNTPEGFADFLVDTKTWVDGFVDAIEGSAYDDTVFAYDITAEYYEGHPYMGWYTRYMYDWTATPKGKMSISVLTVPDDLDDMATELAVSPPAGGRFLSYLDFRDYPPAELIESIEDAHDDCKAAFPDTTVFLGEFGYNCSNSSQESAQQSTELGIVEDALTEDLPYMLHWMLWDDSPEDDVHGWGYSENSPKDVMGGMSEALQLVLNPDMETISGGHPTYWTHGGTVSRTFTYESGAATNTYYARLRADDSPGSVWIVCSGFQVDGSKEIYVNGYIRSDMQNVKMTVNEYNSSWGFIKATSGSTFNPGWSFKNYIHETGPWSVTLTADTYYVIISIGATCSTDPSYLDVDCVSAWIR